MSHNASGSAELRPTAGIVVRHSFTSDLLLVLRARDHTWAVPGGHLEPGETWLAAALREFAEETGFASDAIDAADLSVLGLYSDPVTQTHRTSDGPLAQYVGVVFEATATGDPSAHQPDDEITEVRWFAPDQLPANLFGPDRPVLDDALSDAPRPFLR